MAILSKFISITHLSFSESVQSDDTKLQSDDHFNGEEVIVFIKEDGEQTTLYPDYIHARSLDSVTDLSRSWVTAMHSGLKHLIPHDVKINGENLWAKHSIPYEDGSIDGYFYMFGAWKDVGDTDYYMDIDDVIALAELLDLPMPKILYRGIYSEKKMKEIAKNLDTSKTEGFVVRTTKGFFRGQENKHIAKWVRKNHVQTDKHWKRHITKNCELSENVRPAFMKKSK